MVSNEDIMLNVTATVIDYKSEILRLKKEKNALILAHYYQEGEVQDLADFIGDSLELARKAKETDNAIILFCGVHFMAETAKIVNPNKKVLLPDLNAGCSLADSAPAEAFKRFREENPDHVAITYINCSTEVKALSDIICTSSNAEKIVQQIPLGKKILFSPDKNLGAYISKKMNREMLLWNGSCIVHETFNLEKILQLQLENPGAKIIAHPECEESLLSHAQFIGSTSQLLRYVNEDSSNIYIVVTEPGILHKMEMMQPEKRFIPAPANNGCACNNCPYMKLNTLEKIYACLRDETPEILMEEDLRVRALKPLEKMLEMS